MEPSDAPAPAAQPPNDPSHTLLTENRRPLDAIFSPESVAVVGASEEEGSVGRTLLWNLLSSPFGGTVYPVNPGRESALGVRAYASVSELPEAPDLAVIAVPAPVVPQVVRECADAGTQGAVIISAGFQEAGAEGKARGEEVLQIARAAGMRLIGPNCLGVMRPPTGLNATFAGGMALPGSVGFISQSGAMMTSILDWSYAENVGFSAFISIGSMLDAGWGDLIHYLGDDPKTDSIVLYMESVGEARSFLSAAREVSLRKPIIIIKAGRTEKAAEAAASHTGTLAGSDAVLDAAFRRVGALRVDGIGDLFSMAGTLSKQPRPEGPRLTILTNAGGPGVLSTDALVSGGGTLAELSDETKARLDDVLPAAWSHANPVDVLGDAPPQRYADALEAAAASDDSDGLLVVLSPQAVTDPTATARQLAARAETIDRPLLSSWMGGPAVAEGNRLLNDANIPTFDYPDEAAQVFNYMWQYSYNLRGLYETPSLSAGGTAHTDRSAARTLLRDAADAGHSLLSEHEAKQLLADYNIPVVPTRLAESAEEAVAHAEEVGYPVVVKLHSHTVTHKIDVGGVKLNLTTAEAVREAFAAIERSLEERGQPEAFEGATVQPMISTDGFEILIGSSLDAQFGPVLLFGTGGSLVEVYQDRALGLPPLNTTLAHRMMEQTKIYDALEGTRGRGAVDFDALEALMVRFSQLAVEQPLIKEIEMNPVLASSERITALDARVVLMDENDERPRPAIRPYPTEYAGRWQMNGAEDGHADAVTIRPIRPEDEPRVVAFHEKLSEESVYRRYAGILKMDRRVAHERLVRICFNDYDREIALVAERDAAGGDGTPGKEILAIGRLTKLPGTSDGEFAMLVIDEEQGRGLGSELLRRLVEVGRDEGLDRIVADILRENRPMQKVCRRLGFEIVRGDLRDPMVKAVKVL